MITNGYILIIHTLTLSANIAHRNGLVRAQVIWLLLLRIDSLITCFQSPPCLHDYFRFNWWWSLFFKTLKCNHFNFWKCVVSEQIAVRQKAWSCLFRQRKETEVITVALKPCGYLNVLQHSNVTQEPTGLSGYVPQEFFFCFPLTFLKLKNIKRLQLRLLMNVCNRSTYQINFNFPRLWTIGILMCSISGSLFKAV